MKKVIYSGLVLSALFTCQASTSYAQIGVNVDITNGLDVNFGGQMRQNTSGNKFLYNTWTKGTVKQADGKVYRDLDLMYDLSESRVIFKSDLGQSLAFANPVSEFTIAAPGAGEDVVSKKYRNGFPPADGNKANTFYEVLSDGNVKLLKVTQLKRVTEVAIGDIYPTRQIKPIDSYYVFENGKVTKIRREKKYLKALLKDKAQDLDTYIASNKLDIKKDADLSTVFDHYNAL